MSLISGFTFSRVVIVQSLEANEIETGTILSEFIRPLSESTGHDLPVELINCQSSRQFLELLQALTQDAAAGDIPLLHVECHGCPVDGLEFENGNTLSWEDLAAALLPLNVASRFNLLAVFSACFGAYFLGQMGAVRPSPCWCLVAPTERIDVPEILNSFRGFYSVLFSESDMGAAARTIAKCNLTHGRWLSEPAELWFERLVAGYVETHCSLPAARKRAKKLYRELKAQGRCQGVGALLRVMRKRNRESLVGDYFNRYFIIDKIPENSQRFEKTRNRVVEKIEGFRASGKFLV